MAQDVQQGPSDEALRLRKLREEEKKKKEARKKQISDYTHQKRLEEQDESDQVPITS